MNLTSRLQRAFTSLQRPPPPPLERAAALASQERHVEAFQVYASVAQTGDPDGQFRVGVCYLEGKGVPANRTEAVRWLEQAAQQRHMDAKLLLAVLMLKGWGNPSDAVGPNSPGLFKADSFPPDPETAAKWARRAAERGCAESQAILGHILHIGPEPLRNVEEARYWYERAADGGSPNGMFGYAVLLKDQVGDNTQEKIISLTRAAAEAGHLPAARALGHLYTHGIGTARDPEQAAHWLRIAAADDHQAQSDLANLMLSGSCRPETMTAIRAWFDKSAQAGDPVAQFNMGLCLAEGLGGPQDEATALQWLRTAGEHIANAQFLYGQMVAKGRGTAADLEEGRSWIARAAAAGMAEAEFALATMMWQGIGGPANKSAATSLLERAAAKGHQGAAQQLNQIKAAGA